MPVYMKVDTRAGPDHRSLSLSNSATSPCGRRVRWVAGCPLHTQPAHVRQQPAPRKAVLVRAVWAVSGITGCRRDVERAADTLGAPCGAGFALFF
jgi:hypothetical protein